MSSAGNQLEAAAEMIDVADLGERDQRFDRVRAASFSSAASAGPARA
jgi:hypothetical protein